MGDKKWGLRLGRLCLQLVLVSTAGPDYGERWGRAVGLGWALDVLLLSEWLACMKLIESNTYQVAEVWEWRVLWIWGLSSPVEVSLGLRPFMGTSCIFPRGISWGPRNLFMWVRGGKKPRP